MTGPESLEREILDQHASAWAARGYHVIVNPRGSDLPEFLKSYQPDAILVGREPKVIVEVVMKGHPNADRKVRNLEALLSGHSDWRLEVLYGGSGESPLPQTSPGTIRKTISGAEEIASIEPRGAFLLLWAALEALVRRLDPHRSSRPQTPGRIVETLAYEGLIEPSEASWLREMSRVRNRIVHGELDVAPRTMDLDRMMQLSRMLLSQIPNQTEN